MFGITVSLCIILVAVAVAVAYCFLLVDTFCCWLCFQLIVDVVMIDVAVVYKKNDRSIQASLVTMKLKENLKYFRYDNYQSYDMAYIERTTE